MYKCPDAGGLLSILARPGTNCVGRETCGCQKVRGGQIMQDIVGLCKVIAFTLIRIGSHLRVESEE